MPIKFIIIMTAALLGLCVKFLFVDKDQIHLGDCSVVGSRVRLLFRVVILLSVFGISRHWATYGLNSRHFPLL